VAAPTVLIAATMQHLAQLPKKWFHLHRKRSTPVNPTSIPTGSSKGNSAAIDPAKSTTTASSVVDNLSLALSLAQQTLVIAQAVPFIKPAVAVLSEILKSYEVYFDL
jgi:hypothetical protein